MSRRVAGGAPHITSSNQVSVGMIEGSQIGTVLPSVLESLQESTAAAKHSVLYYPETLGMFNLPSFQKSYGLYNATFPNITRFGDAGDLFLEKDFFWRGPCAIQFTVKMPWRFSGMSYNCSSAVIADGSVYLAKPAVFYSEGAGYAALKQVEMNLGGAGTYRIDRYANFVGIMASCATAEQRAALMKLSGGGLCGTISPLSGSAGITTSAGLAGNVGAQYTSNIRNYFSNGAPHDSMPYDPSQSSFTPGTFTSIDSDVWLVCVKTPHTNFHSATNRMNRLPIDMNLVSTPFSLQIETAPIQDFMDAGAGQNLYPAGYPDRTPAFFANIGCNATIGATAPAANMSIFGSVDIFRQYAFLYGEGNHVYVSKTWGGDVPVHEQVLLVNRTYTNGNSAIFPSVVGFLTEFGRHLYPITVNKTTSPAINALLPTESYLRSVGNPYPAPMNREDLNDAMTIEVSHIVPSIRLTNDQLGAFNVLKQTTNMAIYYPFQHLTSQMYYVEDHSFADITMADLIYENSSLNSLLAQPPSKRPFTAQIPITIPVNPMTAMYVMVFREKDRRQEAPGTIGAYSPALFWNGLQFSRWTLSYGSENICIYDNASQHSLQQLYDRITPLVIPYRGGVCTKGEYGKWKAEGTEHAYWTAGGNQYSYPTASSSIISGGPPHTQSATGLHPNIARCSYLYEIDLVERSPFKDESVFQQTPSFQGEQLNLRFTIEPTLSAHGRGAVYSPFEDLSLLHSYAPDYSNTEFTPKQAYSELCSLYNFDDTDAVRRGYRPVSQFPGPPISLSACDLAKFGSDDPDGLGPLDPADKGYRKVSNPWVLNNGPLLVSVIFAQNALWQMNPSFSKVVFARG